MSDRSLRISSESRTFSSIASLRSADITERDQKLFIKLGRHPVIVPAPFDELLRTHREHRPNLRTGAGSSSPWLFPGGYPGRHIDPQTLMTRLRQLGVNLLGARNRAIADLVSEVPPAIVADAIGYTHQTAFHHAAAAGDTWARYVGGRRVGPASGPN